MATNRSRFVQINSAFLELVVILFQLLIGHHLGYQLLGWFSELVGIYDVLPRTLVVAFHQIIVSAFVLFSITFTVSANWKLGVRDVVNRIGATNVRVSSVAVAICTCHVMAFVALIYTQHALGRYIFSWDNYFSNGELNYARVFNMLILSPIKEEFVFRGLMFFSLQQTFGPSKRYSVFISSFLFGTIHFLNMSSSQYSQIYIGFQVVLGTTIGLFYALRAAATNSLWDSLILHIVNNFFASFMSVSNDMDVSDPLLGIPLAMTFIFYMALIRRAWVEFTSLERILLKKKSDAGCDPQVAKNGTRMSGPVRRKNK
eukprot:432797_1